MAATNNQQEANVKHQRRGDLPKGKYYWQTPRQVKAWQATAAEIASSDFVQKYITQAPDGGFWRTDTDKGLQYLILNNGQIVLENDYIVFDPHAWVVWGVTEEAFKLMYSDLRPGAQAREQAKDKGEKPPKEVRAEKRKERKVEAKKTADEEFNSVDSQIKQITLRVRAIEILNSDETDNETKMAQIKDLLSNASPFEAQKAIEVVKEYCGIEEIPNEIEQIRKEVADIKEKVEKVSKPVTAKLVKAKKPAAKPKAKKLPPEEAERVAKGAAVPSKKPVVEIVKPIHVAKKEEKAA
jgi:hypothetical protein